MRYLLAFALLTTSALAFAQDSNYSSDVKTIDSIVAALYNVISGAPDEPRDWERFRNLFTKDSRLIPTNKDKQGTFGIRSISPDDYVQLFQNNIKKGFYEIELHHVVEEYGTIAHVFSSYSTTETPNGPPFNRGINSIQLFKDQDRYYIVNVLWCAESMGFEIPQKYLN